MNRPAAASIACGMLLAAWVGSALAAEVRERPFEVRVVGLEGASGSALRQAILDDLMRTPLRHDRVLVGQQEPGGTAPQERVLALLELRLDEEVTRPTIELARSGDELTPGWLVHSVLRAGATVGVTTEVADPRSSWLGQLVARSTHNPDKSAADKALGEGVPALTLALPVENDFAARLLAATVRRLDGLEGYPLFEDEFLVVGRRVFLRRDLYWIGLAMWLALFWRGRNRPGREFRWLLLAAWLVAPVFASLLLVLPALVAAWWPEIRWARATALAPVVFLAIRLGIAVAGPAALVISGLPALLVLLALAAFVWNHRSVSHRAGAGDTKLDASETKV